MHDNLGDGLRAWRRAALIGDAPQSLPPVARGGNDAQGTMDDSTMAELAAAIEKSWEWARKFGLDPFPVHFEVVPATIMYEFGAYLLPGRFSHWSHGKGYYRQKTSYDYGLSRIYELVVNTNPAYAFLLDVNSVLQNKLVIAHVLGHVDFFKNNVWYGHTNRQMIDTVSLHAERIALYERKYGQLEVEKFLDAVLSIEYHFETNPRVKKTTAAPEGPIKLVPESEFDDLFSKEIREKQREFDAREKEAEKRHRKFPPEPDKDILGFLMTYSRDLEDWQRDIISIIRSEQMYFLPQMQTKIMNEGWASLWHQRILRELDLTDGEIVEFAQVNSGVLAPNRRQINPYLLGVKIWEDIERRWDSPNERERTELHRPGEEGRKKIFEVREEDNDVSFLRNYLSEEVIEELDMYIYEKRDGQWVITDKDWRSVRDRIVASMTNFGVPIISVEDADYRGNRELYLKHSYEGTPLDPNYSEKTIQYIYQLWGRSVHLETVMDNKNTLLSYDGRSSTKRTISSSSERER